MTPDTYTMTVSSPIGALVLGSDGEALNSLLLPSPERATPRDSRDVPPVLVDAGTQLAEYFAGERKVFELPTRLAGTAFQRAVWAELARIPYGTAITYGELARRVGRPTSYRAVGQANGRNPVPIVVPCHRVVASDGIGGYGGGIDAKRVLLRVEGWAAPRSG